MNRRKNKYYKTLIQNQQAKIDIVNNNIDNNTTVSAYENHPNVIIRPSNVGKTCCMMKILEKIANKNLSIS